MTLTLVQRLFQSAAQVEALCLMVFLAAIVRFLTWYGLHELNLILHREDFSTEEKPYRSIKLQLALSTLPCLVGMELQGLLFNQAFIDILARELYALLSRLPPT